VVGIQIDQDADELNATLITGEPMPLMLRGQQHTLQPGDTLRLRYQADRADRTA
jgi:hypothetical protein